MLVVVVLYYTLHRTLIKLKLKVMIKKLELKLLKVLFKHQ